MKRERYLAKEALAENKVGCGSSSTPFFKAFFCFKFAQRRRRARRWPCKELWQLLLVRMLASFFCGSGPPGELGDKRQRQRHGSGRRQGLGNGAVRQQLSTAACPEARGMVPGVKGSRPAPPRASRRASPPGWHTGVRGRLLLTAGSDAAGSGCLSKLIGITARQLHRCINDVAWCELKAAGHAACWAVLSRCRAACARSSPTGGPCNRSSACICNE